MTVKSDTKFIEKRACDFKYDMTNLVNFHPTSQKSENLFWMGSTEKQRSYLSRQWKVMQNLNEP